MVQVVGFVSQGRNKEVKYQIIRNVSTYGVMSRIPKWFRPYISKSALEEDESYTLIIMRDTVVLSGALERAMKDVPEGKIIVVARELTTDAANLLTERCVPYQGRGFWTDASYLNVRQSL